MRRGLGVACLAIVFGMAVGCGDPEQADDRGEPADPRATAAGEMPPPLPQAARKNTVAGAKAFIRYYWAVFTYAQSTGDTAPLRAAGSARCSTCEDDAWFIEHLYERGSRVKGGEHVVRDISHPERQSPGELAFVVRLHVEREVITRGEGEGRRLVTGPGTKRNLMIVVREENGWLLDFDDIHETGAS
jgi:hypothetical protein